MKLSTQVAERKGACRSTCTQPEATGNSISQINAELDFNFAKQLTQVTVSSGMWLLACGYDLRRSDRPLQSWRGRAAGSFLNRVKAQELLAILARTGKAVTRAKLLHSDPDLPAARPDLLGTSRLTSSRRGLHPED